MSDVIAIILVVVVVVFAVTYVIITAAKARNDHRQEERLSIAFDRAQSSRTRGVGFREAPRLYAETIWPDERGE